MGGEEGVVACVCVCMMQRSLSKAGNAVRSHEAVATIILFKMQAHGGLLLTKLPLVSLLG